MQVAVAELRDAASLSAAESATPPSADAAALREARDKAQAQLEKLQDHLISMEEQHTQEALARNAKNSTKNGKAARPDVQQLSSTPLI